MDAKTLLIEATRSSVDWVFRTARVMPEDRLTWKPAEDSRSALEQLQECAWAPDWHMRMLSPEGVPPFSPELMEQVRAERAQWKTLEECERVCRERTEQLCALIRDFPDAELEKKVMMPWGQELRAIDVMGLHYWNCTYHLGAINYIQTMYGDREMR